MPIWLGEFLAKELPYVILAVFIGVLIGFGVYYHHAYETQHDAYVILQNDVKTQNEQATAKYKQLLADNEAKQLQIDNQFKKQVTQDDQAKKDISSIVSNVAVSPIRVRYVARASRCNSDSADSAKTPDAAISATDTSTTDGVLPQLNSERLASAIGEIETLNAAFASCKATW